MSFGSDRNLLVLEPNLFRDVKFSGQVLVTGMDGVVSGTTLSSLTSDFVLQQVKAGMVVLVAGVPVEILDVLSANSLTVSRLRADESGSAIPPGPGIGLQFEIVSYLPQIESVHVALLGAFGVDGFSAPGEPTEADILNVREASLVEALGALYLIYAGASALVSDQGLLWTKATSYRARYMAARRALELQFDLDGDGLTDASRTSSSIRLTRS